MGVLVSLCLRPKKSGCTDASKTITIIPGIQNTVTINMSCGTSGSEGKTSDIDGDGVADDEDSCYNPDCNIVDSRGCPEDYDRDGLNDCKDDCPTEKGTAANEGCPVEEKDKDRDGSVMMRMDATILTVILWIPGDAQKILTQMVSTMNDPHLQQDQ